MRGETPETAYHLGVLRVLRNPAYRALFGAQVIALVGTGLLTVALGLLAFDIAGDAAGAVLGTALTIKMVAYVGVAPLIAALVERLPTKAVLIGADLVRLSIALFLPLVGEVWQIYLLVFVLQAASATFTPAFQALIPALLPEPAEYTRALALSRLAYDLEAVLSPMVAAALLTVVGYSTLFVGTAAGFAASALLVLIARLPARADQPRTETFWRRVTVGVRVFAAAPTLRFLLLANVVVAAATALVLVNSVVYVKVLLARDDTALALTLAAFGGGSLVAALVIPQLVDRFGVIPVMRAGGLAVVAGLAGAFAATAAIEGGALVWWPVLAAWGVLGAGTSLIATPSARLLAEASTPANRHLVYTAQFALSHACFLVTYPLAGWLGAVSLTATVAVLLALAAAAAAGGALVARRVPTGIPHPAP
ncbi:MFS transporter [Microbacterium aureliae]